MKDFKPLVPVNPEGLDEVARSLLEETPQAKAQPSGIAIKARINPSDYIRIPDTSIVIAKRQPQEYNNKKWDEAHFALGENGLFMPTPSLFMKYFLGVLAAKQGSANLYDASGSQIAQSELDDLYTHLTKHKNGAWTWLDAKFVKGNGAFDLDIETDHRVIGSGNKKKLASRRKPLEASINEDCYVDLDFNAQGMPKRKSDTQDYAQGNNIYHWFPRENAVARFNANSGRAYLDCNRNPQYSFTALGVLACAEGAAPKKGEQK